MQKSNLIKDTRVGLGIFLLFLVVCLITRPSGLYVNSGISYYSNFPETLLPYILAFSAASYYVWQFSNIITHDKRIGYFLRIGFRIVSVFIILVLLTSGSFRFFDPFHRTAATVLFAIQFAMSIAITIYYGDKLSYVLLALAMIGGYGGLIYLMQPTGYMIESQIIFQTSVWALYIRYAKSIGSY
ncbi:hypothetical protein HGB24_02660 [Candidatus Saccharibacteria bacterium]|nr:hypothetical protein [Candidatus Saccharibacteria bacterium]